MEVCTNTPQANGQVHGAASPYVDPDFEFNAPRFYDFQRLNDSVSSPSSEGDTYFDTSKVKGNIPATVRTQCNAFFAHSACHTVAARDCFTNATQGPHQE